jgi:peptidoglycan/LPS O-acetylase OafA/YrhL
MSFSNATTDTPRFRHWADVVGIVVGLGLLAISIWPSGVTASEEAAQGTRSPDTVYLVRALAGLAALASVVVGQRWRQRTVARVLMASAGAALLFTLLTFNDLGARALLTLLLPALLLLAAAAAVGPMPRPQPPHAGGTI